MCTEKSNGGPFVTFREECESLRGRVSELEAQLAAAKNTARSNLALYTEAFHAENRIREQLAERDAFHGYGGVTLWLGDFRVQKIITETQAEHVLDVGLLLTDLTQESLNLLVKAHQSKAEVK